MVGVWILYGRFAVLRSNNMVPITLEALIKRFGSTTAVDSVSLRIEPGELFFLLGPSGCGKTTLLRMIAGFVEPTSGRVRLGEKDVTNLPPEKRQTGMVFQNYALWPHMSVGENVGFGLAVRKIARSERDQRIKEALDAVRMGTFIKRKPNELSGGQQQRVALARALVIRPRVLLLDEPLSNLDAKLRLEMRSEIRRICKETGITTVYVTHDQKEALSMADGVAVLREGQAIQVGPPRELYMRPANRFVADFLGETNFVQAEVADASNGKLCLDSPAGAIESTVFNSGIPRGGNVTCSIRPEAWIITPAKTKQDAVNSQVKSLSPNRWHGQIVDTMYLGEISQHVIELPGETRVKAFELNPQGLLPGQSVELSVNDHDVIVLND